jgi:hypothetical protein
MIDIIVAIQNVLKQNYCVLSNLERKRFHKMKITVKIVDDIKGTNYAESITQFLERIQGKEVTEIILDVIDESIEIKFADKTSILGLSTRVINYEYCGIRF